MPGLEGFSATGCVAIHSYTWNIVIVVPPGIQPASNRVTAFGVYITNGVSSDWHEFLTSANQILLAAAA